MKTTEKHFQIFKTECEKWIGFFGLYGWKICYTHEDGERNCLANFYINELCDRVVTINLAPNWPKDSLNELQIRKTAFHEACEVLLCRISAMAYDRFVTKPMIDEEIHNLIRIFENRFFSI